MGVCVRKSIGERRKQNAQEVERAKKRQRGEETARGRESAREKKREGERARGRESAREREREGERGAHVRVAAGCARAAIAATADPRARSAEFTRATGHGAQGEGEEGRVKMGGKGENVKMR
eukprot:5045957-Pleurochrysis_carterae.AAC.2